MRKTNLRNFHNKRLFLREDVAPDHKLRQKPSVPSQSNVVASQQCSTTSVTVEPPPTNTDNTPDYIPALHASKQGCLSGPQQRSSSLPLPELRRSGSPVTLSRSVSPSPASIASLSSLFRVVKAIMMAPLKCCSFNCRGWNNGKLSLTNFINSLDLCFIQEHWLLSDHLNDVCEIFFQLV